ncbi:MAG TPA: glycosyltransferase family 87 protein, partial [Vicinamibacterales bacterium]|nr:glycosyltransferase family 87 protein [Vicinamibacterales bacterium]
MTLSVAQHRQIRLHLAFIPVYVWIIWVWTSYAVNVSPSGRIDRTGHVKGQDFTHDYVLGQIAREHATGDLYNFDAQSRRMDRLFPDYEVRYAPVHGPQLSLLFAPLARMPYESALWVWLALSVSGYATCCAVLYGTAPRLRRYAWVVVVLAIGYPPFYFLIAFGQISVVGLACVTAAYLAFRARRPWLAGLALGTLAYKPPLGIAIVLVMVYGREWQVLGGAFVAAVVQLAAAAAYYGPTVLVTYADTVGDATQIASVFEPILHRMQSLRSFFLLLVPLPRVAFAAYVCSAAAVVIAAARYWT